MKFRDLMAPDTEPTDEELAQVMREARDLAVQRRIIAEAHLAARLDEEVRLAHARYAKTAADEGGRT
jgi:hypothetical protein